MSGKRAYDVVVFGATGFTGHLVAEYLARNAGEQVNWAIAGRNRARLQAVKAKIAALGSAGGRAGIIEADKSDYPSLLAMAHQTRVLITTVGPYILGGDVVVRACIDGGADYVDITGEPEFVKRVVQEHDERARTNGVRIVNCCGFDSIPTDLGVLYTMSHLPDGEPAQVDGFIQTDAEFSGGTWRSAIEAMSGFEMMKKWLHKRKHKAHTSPTPGPRRVRISNPRVRRDPQFEQWVYPLPTIDPLVVRRSARALDSYGPDFCYAHHGASRSLSKLVMLTAGIGAVVALAQFGPTKRRLLDYRKSGEGPTAERRASSWFKATFVGTSGTSRVVTCVSGGDPGYDETAKMVSESALCLAFDSLPERAGVLTTAQAMGQTLIERLHAADIRFDVIEQT